MSLVGNHVLTVNCLITSRTVLIIPLMERTWVGSLIIRVVVISECDQNMALCGHDGGLLDDTDELVHDHYEH